MVSFKVAICLFWSTRLVESRINYFQALKAFSLDPKRVLKAPHEPHLHWERPLGVSSVLTHLNFSNSFKTPSLQNFWLTPCYLTCTLLPQIITNEISGFFKAPFEVSPRIHRPRFGTSPPEM